MSTPSVSEPNNDKHLNTNRGIIAWFARNSVAANLLMFGIILLGLYSAMNIRKQMFPMGESNRITVSAVYRRNRNAIALAHGEHLFANVHC